MMFIEADVWYLRPNGIYWIAEQKSIFIAALFMLSLVGETNIEDREKYLPHFIIIMCIVKGRSH